MYSFYIISFLTQNFVFLAYRYVNLMCVVLIQCSPRAASKFLANFAYFENGRPHNYCITNRPLAQRRELIAVCIVPTEPIHTVGRVYRHFVFFDFVIIYNIYTYQI